jgi:hypothetical protein
MARPDANTLAQLMMRARYTLSTAHSDVPSLLHTSKRTMQRWQAAQSHPSDTELAAIARHLHPIDPQLAGSVAEAMGQTLETLGIVAPQPPPPPALPPMPRHLVVDAVVCAAADATDAAPSAVRAILLAAFRRARELGLSTDEVEKALQVKVERAVGKGK